MWTAKEAKENTSEYNPKREKILRKIERGIKKAAARGETEYCVSWIAWGPQTAAEIEIYLEDLGYHVGGECPFMVISWL